MPALSCIQPPQVLPLILPLWLPSSRLHLHPQKTSLSSALGVLQKRTSLPLCILRKRTCSSISTTGILKSSTCCKNAALAAMYVDVHAMLWEGNWGHTLDCTVLTRPHLFLSSLPAFHSPYLQLTSSPSRTSPPFPSAPFQLPFPSAPC